MTGTYQSKHGPVEGCPVSETPIRDRAWTDGQRLARLRELAELRQGLNPKRDDGRT